MLTCKICGELVPAARRANWPHAKTCSHACAVTLQKETHRRIARESYHKRKKIL